VDAHVLATAQAAYVMLNSTDVGASYEIIVAGDGVGKATFNGGTNGAAFGVADGTVMTVLDLPLAAYAQAVDEVLYGGNAAKRSNAKNILGAVNPAGGI
jgi:hypothetical protein